MGETYAFSGQLAIDDTPAGRKLGGGAVNFSRASACVSTYLGLYSRPHVVSFMCNNAVEQFDALADEGIDPNGVMIDGELRVNVIQPPKTIYGESKMLFTDDDVDKLLQLLFRMPKGSYLGITGSVPANLSPGLLATIIEVVKWKDAHVLVDLRPELLKAVMRARDFPLKFTVKLNHEEAGEYLKIDIDPTDTLANNRHIVRRLRRSSRLSHRKALITCGQDGMLFYNCGQEAWRITGQRPADVPYESHSGSGDALAGAYATRAQFDGPDPRADAIFQLATGARTSRLDPIRPDIHCPPLLAAAIYGQAAGVANTADHTPGYFDLDLYDRILRDEIVARRVA